MAARRESLPCLRPQERVGREARNSSRNAPQGRRAGTRRPAGHSTCGPSDTDVPGYLLIEPGLSNTFRGLLPTRYAIDINTDHDGRSFRQKPADGRRAGRFRSRFGRKRFRHSHISRASPLGTSSLLKSSLSKLGGPLRSGGRPNTERPSYGSVTGARLACTAKT